MDRWAAFIDVGYVLAVAGENYLGTTYRPYIECEFSALITALATTIEEHAGMPTLRVHWYDAAYNARPTYQQEEVARLTGVKLRLGRIVEGRQKGVDSMIVRDLMTLARERAMATAYLVSGDEDVREGVAEAQDMGSRVVLLGLPGSNQARTLIQEADEHIVLPDEFWRPHFRRLGPVEISKEQPTSVSGGLNAIAGIGGIPATVASHGDEVTDAYHLAAAQAGAEFARGWGREVSPDDLRRVLSQPVFRVPRDVDAQLLGAADRELGGFLRSQPDLRVHVRNGFYAELAKVAAEREISSAPEPPAHVFTSSEENISEVPLPPSSLPAPGSVEEVQQPDP